MSEEEARAAFRAIRWSDNDGEPYCPKCGTRTVYGYRTRPLWKCRECKHQFSVTSGTIFASHKLAIRDYLLAIAIFCNGAKGHSALQLSRDLNVQYKTAFVLAHKLREAMSAHQEDDKAKGQVEIDGGYFGGYVKPANFKEHRLDRRARLQMNGKRKVVVVVRERGGKSITFVAKSESASVRHVHDAIALGSTIHADEGSAWDRLHARYAMKRINHTEAYSADGACTNQAESYFSRLRRAEIGTHHHIAGPYLEAYADEMSWREDHRRISNGEQFAMIAQAAMKAAKSDRWCGYWQRNWE